MLDNSNTAIDNPSDGILEKLTEAALRDPDSAIRSEAVNAISNLISQAQGTRNDPFLFGVFNQLILGSIGRCLRFSRGDARVENGLTDQFHIEDGTEIFCRRLFILPDGFGNS
jgi:hypothetical protein